VAVAILAAFLSAVAALTVALDDAPAATEVDR